MKIKRILFLINSLWELARFLLVFLALVVSFRSTLLADRGAVYWLILLGSAQLLLPAALLMLYLDPPRFGGLLSLVRLGKFLGILAALLLVFLAPWSAASSAGPGRVSPFAAYALLVAGTLADMVLLFLLFLWSPDSQPGSLASPPEGRSLPQYRETPIDVPPEQR